MDTRLTADELFREFALTHSPFEKWHLFSHIHDEATFIYLPYQKQNYLCNIQFGIFEYLQSNDEKKINEGRELMKWLASHQKRVVSHFGTAAPSTFYSALKKMTPESINDVTEKHAHLHLLFNLKKLTFQGKPKTLKAKLHFWR